MILLYVSLMGSLKFFYLPFFISNSTGKHISTTNIKRYNYLGSNCL